MHPLLSIIIFLATLAHAANLLQNGGFSSPPGLVSPLEVRSSNIVTGWYGIFTLLPASSAHCYSQGQCINVNTNGLSYINQTLDCGQGAEANLSFFAHTISDGVSPNLEIRLGGSLIKQLVVNSINTLFSVPFNCSAGSHNLEFLRVINKQDMYLD